MLTNCKSLRRNKILLRIVVTLLCLAMVMGYMDYSVFAKTLVSDSVNRVFFFTSDTSGKMVFISTATVDELDDLNICHGNEKTGTNYYGCFVDAFPTTEYIEGEGITIPDYIQYMTSKSSVEDAENITFDSSNNKSDKFGYRPSDAINFDIAYTYTYIYKTTRYYFPDLYTYYDQEGSYIPEEHLQDVKDSKIEMPVYLAVNSNSERIMNLSDEIAANGGEITGLYKDNLTREHSLRIIMPMMESDLGDGSEDSAVQTMNKTTKWIFYTDVKYKNAVDSPITSLGTVDTPTCKLVLDGTTLKVSFNCDTEGATIYQSLEPRDGSYYASTVPQNEYTGTIEVENYDTSQPFDIYYMAIKEGYDDHDIMKVSTANYVLAEDDVDNVKITSEPNLTYTEGETFSTSGMAITATYGDGHTDEVTDYTVSNTNPLTTADNKITITATYKGQTYTFDRDITVNSSTPSGQWDGTVDTSWYSPEASSYDITTVNQLAGLAAIVNGTAEGIEQSDFAGKTVNLMNDLSIDEAGKYTAAVGTFGSSSYPMHNVTYYKVNEDAVIWTPIGTAVTATTANTVAAGNYFAGTFNGNSHKVSGVYTDGTKSAQGLFGCVSGTVKDLSVDGCITAKMLAGGIAAYLNGGTVSNCVNDAVVYADGGQTADSGVENGQSRAGAIGGIVGRALGTTSVEDCVNNADITCTNSSKGGRAGGIIGLIDAKTDAGHISGCVNNGDVNSYQYSGGIVGLDFSESYPIDQCVNNGNIFGYSSGSTYIGGITAMSYSNISNSYNTGDYKIHLNSSAGTKAAHAGGIVSDFLGTAIANCYNTGSFQYDGTATFASSYGTICGTGYGSAANNKLKNCYSLSSAAVTGEDLNNGCVQVKTSDEMKTADFLTSLNNRGNAFIADSVETPANSGYPVLNPAYNGVVVTLDSVAITANPQTEYTEGDTFSTSGMAITATYSDGTTEAVTDYVVDNTNPLTTADDKITVTATYNGQEYPLEVAITVNAAPATLDSVAITTNPQTEYTEGDTFSTSGMAITATYSDGTTEAVTDYVVDNTNPLTTADDKITITATYNGQEYPLEVAITVNAKPVTLKTVAITTNPQLVYTEGDTFSTSGMAITATYSDDSTEAVTDYVVSNTNPLTTADDKITITASYKGQEYTLEVAITVNPVIVTQKDFILSAVPQAPSASVGGTFDVKVVLNSDQMTSFSGIEAYLNYDKDMLEVTNVEVNPAMGIMGGYATPAGIVKYVGIGDNKEIGEGFTIMTVTFKVLDSIPDGRTETSFGLGDESYVAIAGGGMGDGTTTELADPAEVALLNISVEMPDAAAEITGVDPSGKYVFGSDISFIVVGLKPGQSVTAQIGDGEPAEITADENGLLTIPAEDITDNVKIEVQGEGISSEAGTIEFIGADAYAASPTGYKLMLFTPSSAKAGTKYLYSNSEMFYSEKYNAYAYFVDAATSEASALEAISTTLGENTKVSYSGDVNCDGVISNADMTVIRMIYSKPVNYNTDTGFTKLSMLGRLEADLLGDKTVDAQDAREFVTILAGR